MKSFLFSVLCLLLLRADAQRFFTPSSRFGQCWVSSIAHNTSVRVAYDTVFNGHLYTKLVSTDTTNGYIFMREANDSIFLWDSWNSQEMLWYDFNLSVGDSIRPPGAITNMVADTVMMITLLNGQQVKYIHLNSCCERRRWIYGVGDVDSGLSQVVEPNNCVSLPHFICASDSSGLLWKEFNPWLPENLCDSFVAIREQPLNLSVRTFPIPTSGHLTINWNEYRPNVVLEIYDMSAGMIFAGKFSGSEAVLDVSDYAAGNYYFILRTNDHQFAPSGKFVVVK